MMTTNEALPHHNRSWSCCVRRVHAISRRIFGVCTIWSHVGGRNSSLQTWVVDTYTEFCAICIVLLYLLPCLLSHIAYYFNCVSTTMNNQTLAPANIAFHCWQLHPVVGMTTMLASLPDQSNKRCCKCAMNDVSTRSYVVVLLTAFAWLWRYVRTLITYGNRRHSGLQRACNFGLGCITTASRLHSL